MRVVDGVRLAHGVLQACTLAAVVYFVQRYPPPTEQTVRARAVQRGWPMAVVRAVVCVQHFTVQSALWLVAALALMLVDDAAAPWVAAVAFAFETMVLVTYHGIVALDPFLIVPRTHFGDPDKAARQLFSAWPPASRSLSPLWAVLHVQHLVAPAHFWLELAVFPDTFPVPALTLRDELGLVLACVGAYAACNFTSWAVRSEPPYPVQRVVYMRGGIVGALVFYGAFICVLLLVSAACRHAREWATTPWKEI